MQSNTKHTPGPPPGIAPSRLGRLARIVDVPVRYADGSPCVVTDYPLARRKNKLVPFPTLFWLACPDLCRQISQLEHDRRIADLQRELDGDNDLARRLVDDHQRYIDLRWRLIDGADRRALIDAGLEREFTHRGIAGMKNFRAVKCLHAHYAHHLADRNVIGELLEQRGMMRRPDVIIQPSPPDTEQP